MRVRLAKAAREELERRKRRLGILTYDDLLTRLDGRARPGRPARRTRRRLRERYRVVLVDEFQDTDPVQWAIMRARVRRGDTTLVLIGDPKQAIYAFRGADVYAYLDAARSAGASATLDVNWRSDQRLLDAYDALFAGAQLGHPGIAYRTVSAAPPNARARLAGAPQGAPLRVRVAPARRRRGAAHALGLRLGAGRARARRARRRRRHRAAARPGATLETRRADGTTLRTAPVAPGDVAVLVRSHRTRRPGPRRARRGRRAGRDRRRRQRVRHRARARLAQAARGARAARALPAAHTAALTPFLGWDAERRGVRDEEEWGALHARLHEWARAAAHARRRLARRGGHRGGAAPGADARHAPTASAR